MVKVFLGISNDVYEKFKRKLASQYQVKEKSINSPGISDLFQIETLSGKITIT